jgi:hypothetical protein
MFLKYSLQLSAGNSDVVSEFIRAHGFFNVAFHQFDRVD